MCVVGCGCGCVCVCAGVVWMCVCVDSLLGYLDILVKNNYFRKSVCVCVTVCVCVCVSQCVCVCVFVCVGVPTYTCRLRCLECISTWNLFYIISHIFNSINAVIMIFTPDCNSPATSASPARGSPVWRYLWPDACCAGARMPVWRCARYLHTHTHTHTHTLKNRHTHTHTHGTPRLSSCS